MTQIVEGLSLAQKELKFSLENLLGKNFWTPRGLTPLKHICFDNVSEKTIRDWMNEGIMVNDKNIKLRYIQRGKAYRTKPEWVVKFFLEINPQLNDE